MNFPKALSRWGRQGADCHRVVGRQGVDCRLVAALPQGVVQALGGAAAVLLAAGASVVGRPVVGRSVAERRAGSDSSS